jgi:ABC-type lipoprotein export system ATPase subunit
VRLPDLLPRRPRRTANTPPNGSSDSHLAPPGHLVEVRDLIKEYRTEAGDFRALNSVSISVDESQFVAVIGKSGSGKSTLINMVTGIDRPTSGEVWVNGTAVHQLSEGELARWRGRNLGIVFQFFQLLPTLSLIDNVMLPMDFCNMYPPRERRDRAMALLDRVGMGARADKLPSAVSGGQQQRAAIARALANDPPIIVADEPTGNLDSRTAEAIFDLFRELVAAGKTILMVTHDNDLAARTDRSIFVADGEVVNEFVVSALHGLDVDQMTLAASKLTPIVYQPGAVIVRQGDEADLFYIITKGVVDVLVQQPGGAEVKVASLQSGQYFGEIALMRGGTRTATVRASEDCEVEVMALDKETFGSLMEDAYKTREEMDSAIRVRLDELGIASR